MSTLAAVSPLPWQIFSYLAYMSPPLLRYAVTILLFLFSSVCLYIHICNDKSVKIRSWFINHETPIGKPSNNNIIIVLLIQKNERRKERERERVRQTKKNSIFYAPFKKKTWTSDANVDVIAVSQSKCEKLATFEQHNVAQRAARWHAV